MCLRTAPVSTDLPGFKRSIGPRRAGASRAALVTASVLLRAVSKLEAERSKGFWRRLSSG